jgi:hypothetical protein
VCAWLRPQAQDQKKGRKAQDQKRRKVSPLAEIKILDEVNTQHDPAQRSKGDARVEEFSAHVGGPIAIGHASRPPTGLTGAQ